MKKCGACALVLLFLFLFAGCNDLLCGSLPLNTEEPYTNSREDCSKEETSSANSREEFSKIDEEVVRKEGETYYIVLPASGTRLAVGKEYEQLLGNMRSDLVRRAEQTIEKEVSVYESNPGYYITEQDGILYLSTEVIVSIDPPSDSSADKEEYELGGCNIDHKHLFFMEPMSE